MPSIFDPRCQRCILHKAAQSVCVPADGPDDAGILFYGEAPGAEEDRGNRPFIGQAGGEYDALLAQAGLSRAEVRTSNTVRCRPPGNRNPTDDERRACMYYTVREIATVQPKVIVALGGSALKALTGKGAVGENRRKLLSLLPEYRSASPVIATYHPAAYLHNPANRRAYSRAIIEDMRLAQKMVNGTRVRAERAVWGEGDVDAALDALERAPLLACDLEWEVLQVKNEPKGGWPWSARGGRRPRAICWSLAGRVDGKITSVAVPFGKRDKRLRSLLRCIPTVYHHAMADLIWLFSLGIDVVLADDTLLLASLLNLDTSLSLESLASTYTEMSSGWKQETKSTLGKMPATQEEMRRLLVRNCDDTVATLLLREKLLEMLREGRRLRALRLYKYVLIPAVSILARTAIDGTPIDEALLARFARSAQRRVIALREEIGDALTVPTDAYETVIADGYRAERLGPYIERALRVKLPRTGKKRALSITNGWLLEYRAQHPVLRKLLLLRKLTKRQGAYYDPWLWLLSVQKDQRLHSVYRLTVASTGRTSAESDKGNTFQQFPRQAQMRSIVRARPNWAILAADQSQIELRIAAHKAQEKTMIRFFNEHVDIHTATAGYIKALGRGLAQREYLRDRDRWMAEVNSDERYGAKPINFGLLYGGGPRVVKVTAFKDYGIRFTDAQAQTGYDAYFALYPDLKPWHDSCWRFVEQGYVDDDLFGRRRMLYLSDEEGPEAQLRKAINMPVQGPASDLALLCTVYTWELLHKEYGKYTYDVAENIGFFHDACLLHFSQPEESAIREIVKEAWEHPPLEERMKIRLSVPLEVDIKVSDCWV